MEYKILGDNLQRVTVQIQPGKKIYAESGAMVYMNGNVSMEAKMRGGLIKGIGRKFTGETAFLSEFTSAGGTGIVSFGGKTSGTIKALQLNPGMDFMVQKDAFLCAEDTINMSVAFQKR